MFVKPNKKVTRKAYKRSYIFMYTNTLITKTCYRTDLNLAADHGYNLQTKWDSNIQRMTSRGPVQQATRGAMNDQKQIHIQVIGLFLKCTESSNSAIHILLNSTQLYQRTNWSEQDISYVLRCSKEQ